MSELRAQVEQGHQSHKKIDDRERGSRHPRLGLILVPIIDTDSIGGDGVWYI